MKKLLTLGLLVVLAVVMFAAPNQPPSDKVLTDQESAQILATIPDKLPVKMAQKRRILVFSVTNGFRHGQSIPAGRKWFEVLASKTGQFEVVVSDSLENFEAEKLKTFDAVCFLNTTGSVFLPEGSVYEAMDELGKKGAKETEDRLKQNLVDYLKNGGGWIGFHSATDTYGSWPEYCNVAGGNFYGHPWRGGDDIALSIEEPENPLLKNTLAGKRMMFKDECYQFKPGSFDRNRSRVLISLDWMRTPISKRILNETKRPDFDFPISWIHNYGKGRIFYSSLGHNPEIFWNNDLMAYHLGGVLYAVGDLPLDATPRGDLMKYLQDFKVMPIAPLNLEELKSSVALIKGWDYSKSPDLFKVLRQSIDSARRSSDQSQRKAVVEVLVSLLERGGNTVDEKKLLMEESHWFQDDALIPPLLKGLMDPLTVFSATYGLAGQKIEPQVVGVREALKKAPDAALPQIVHYLASPKWNGLVSDVVPYLKKGKPEALDAALNTLTKMADPKAYQALAEYIATQKSPEGHLKASYALLEAASLWKDFAKTQSDMEKLMEDTSLPEHLRLSAATYYFSNPELYNKKNIDMLVGLTEKAVLKPGSPVWFGLLAKIQEGVDFPGKALVPINKSFEGLSSDLKRVVISAYADGDIKDLIGASCKALEKDPSLGPVCAYAAWKLPSPQWVQPLIDAAVKLKDHDQLLTTEGVTQMRSKAVEEEILKAIQNRTPEKISVLADVIQIRKMASAKPILMEWVSSTNEVEKNAGLKAIGSLSTASDLPTLLSWLASFNQEAQVELVERAVQQVFQYGTPTGATAALIECYKKSKELPNKLSVVRLLSKTGEIEAFKKIAEIIEHDADQKVKRKAVEALGDSKSEASLDILKKIAAGSDEALRVLATRSAGNILKNFKKLPKEKMVVYAKEWLALCKNADQYRSIISAISAVSDSKNKIEMTALLGPLSANPEIAQEVKIALKNME